MIIQGRLASAVLVLALWVGLEGVEPGATAGSWSRPGAHVAMQGNGDLPDQDLPGGDLSDADLPDQDLPGGGLSDRDLPDPDLPGGGLSDRDLPDQDLPGGGPSDRDLRDKNLPSGDL